ncbi:MAG: hypothetical protein M1820_003893 [Bogoriella megaspora]|nr:MAG: hypothetical protein M1820_003893 [Bogoriella megaspora]
MYPNDVAENERLDLQYETLKILFDQKTFFAPVSHPRKVLDVGTGTGGWVMDVAQQFPECEVTGIDLSPIQPDWVPDNVHFVVDDATEEDWMIEPDSYDLIHTRVMLTSFEDFREIIARSFKYLKPGGWMESQEFMPSVYCDDSTMTPQHPFYQWTKLYDEAVMKMNRPGRIANKLKRWYEQAGFVDVQEIVFKLPINSWPKDEKLKRLGRLHEAVMQDGLQAFSLAPFHRAFGWSKDEIEVSLVDARKSLSDRNVHTYSKVFVVWGRKPYPGEARTA